ncbi:MAG: uridine kinase, partial [Marmoricola sp.]|nr:uridine kinase [Marmoricola sp.]
SGAGKSRLAHRLGLPEVRLDDFYKPGDDPTLPRLALAGGAPGEHVVDWDSPASWNLDAALGALESLCREGRTEVPVYDIATSQVVGRRLLDVGGSAYVVADGIFAPEVVAACRERGVLAAAVCVTQHPALTFWRRLTRDLHEHRKPPWVLVRRGLRLARAQRHVVAEARARGCRVMTPDQAYADLTALTRRLDRRTA